MTVFKYRVQGILWLIWAAGGSLFAQYNFSVSQTEGCTPFKVKYRFINNATVDTIRSYLWNFGDGQTSTEKDPDTVIYTTGGKFSPSLKLNGRDDLTITRTNLLEVHRTVEAQFRYYDTVTYLSYVFEHTDVLDSNVTYTFTWNFEDVGVRTGRWELVTFPRVDSFHVTLSVSDNYGCESESEKLVIINETILVQNVFTPNGDNINDFFMVSSNGSYPLSLRVFNRNGVMVYKGEGSTITWDGRSSSGQELITGVYFYILEALSGDPIKRYDKNGLIYLYR